MSKLVKERIIYITNIVLGLLTLGFLFVPFVSSTIYESVNGVTQPTLVVYNGYDILFNLGVTVGNEIEGIMLLLAVVLTLASVASAFLGASALKNNIKNNEKFAGKKIFILLNIVYVFCAFALTLVVLNFVNTINTLDDPITGYSICLFACVTGIKIQYYPCIFMILGLGVLSAFTTCIFSGMAKDNSLVLPYTKREVISSIVTIVACIAVFFLPLFNYVYDTNFLNTNASTAFDSAIASGSDLTVEYNIINGYNMFYFSGGGMSGYIKMFYYAMLFVAIVGLIYNVSFLLGATKLLHINLDRKLNDLINFVLTICGIFICVGCVAYCIGVNYQLDRNWETYSAIRNLASIWAEGHFTYSYTFAGAYIALFPVASLLSVKMLNDYLD